MTDTVSAADMQALTAQIVAAYVARNKVEVSQLPGLIQTIHRSLSSVGTPVEAPVEKPVPAVPVRKSVTADYIICLEDGKKLKMLKRHLMTAFNMTPEQYREKWDLPADYPMVAPSYAAQRSELAKTIGLGTSRSRRNGGE
ncbi:MAG: MucR family transcriptional regulator [Alphaproteobacteria bacterium]|nr:MucR family transcriptional regulator [Alphaproteobacteria bacterium]TAD88657.1 MAG: MucR family transcriptional regulator [Alphaproteobacteria bacterium]